MEHCTLGLFQDASFAWDFLDVPVGSQSGAEPEILSSDAGLRMESFPARQQWDWVQEIFAF